MTGRGRRVGGVERPSADGWPARPAGRPDMKLDHQVARAIRAGIEARLAAPGRPIPAVDRLAEHWGITARIVRQALKVLVDEHVLERATPDTHGFHAYLVRRQP